MFFGPEMPGLLSTADDVAGRGPTTRLSELPVSWPAFEPAISTVFLTARRAFSRIAAKRSLRVYGDACFPNRLAV